jgi:hypothetical protein
MQMRFITSRQFSAFTSHVAFRFSLIAKLRQTHKLRVCLLRDLCVSAVKSNSALLNFHIRLQFAATALLNQLVQRARIIMRLVDDNALTKQRILQRALMACSGAPPPSPIPLAPL